MYFYYFCCFFLAILFSTFLDPLWFLLVLYSLLIDSFYCCVCRSQKSGWIKVIPQHLRDLKFGVH